MKLYQCLQAYTAEDIEQRIASAIALGYIPIGGISATQEEHNIKGTQTVLRQSLLYAPLVHSASDLKQVHDTAHVQRFLLESVVENTKAPYRNIANAVEIDADIVQVIEAHLQGDAE